ncbi:MAG TPA: L-threonylcarbamoyladenylate synthase [Syntrophales bacterium]|nr:L-threonylcarbamoyladenylate synthase [Syntrophales bacterium]
MEILKIPPGYPEGKTLDRAVMLLREGRVLAFPTETFYGLACDGKNEKAVARLFEIKGRRFDKPVPVIIGDRGGLEGLVAEISREAEKLMEAFWPGPLTLVLKALPTVSGRLTAGSGKIGVRLSSHPLALRLARGLGGPVTATSANRAGEKECSSAVEVLSALGDRIDGLVDGGRTPGGKGSTLVDVTVNPPAILRDGVISADRIWSILG